MATARQHPPIKKKVYVQRDYSTGMKVSFNSRMPEELDGKLNPEVFKRTIDRLNELYNEAETITSWTLCEGCLACLTAYSLYLCIDTQYEKVLKKIAKSLDEENVTCYAPRGLLIKDPIHSGLRSIEIVIFQDESV